MLQLRDMNNHRRPQSILLALLLLAAASVGAHAQQATGQQAPARQQKNNSFFDTLMEGPRLTTTPLEAPEWMQRRRTGREQEFVPVGPPPNQPQRTVLTEDQIKAKEAELDAVARRHDQIAGRKGYKGKIGTASAPPIKRVKPKPMPCVLTCETGLGTPTRK
ncbi:MAG: hypothetical protein J0I16_09070 [Rhizobiales bacterium]|nr:hypothetical protein [Hyphomicrobiales bacterium]